MTMTSQTLTPSVTVEPPAGSAGICDEAEAAPPQAASFDELYEQYARPIYNLVLRSVRDVQGAEDVCQEIWIKVYRQLDTLRDPETARAWLYRLAHRTCIDAARSRTRIPESAGIVDDTFAADGEDPAAAVLQHDESRLVWQTLGALPPRQHTALFLREVQGCNYREIARILETSESAVETLLFRARGAISRTYAGVEQDRRGRCHRATQLIAALVDGETTPVQARALQAHVDECSSCADELTVARRTSAALVAIPFLPVPSLLGQRIAATIGTLSHAGPHGGLATALAHIVGASKTIAIATVATGAVAASTLIVPFDSPGAAAGTPDARASLAASAAAGGAAMAAAAVSYRSADATSVDDATAASVAGASGAGTTPADSLAKALGRIDALLSSIIADPTAVAASTTIPELDAIAEALPSATDLAQRAQNAVDQAVGAAGAVAGASGLAPDAFGSAPAIPAPQPIQGSPFDGATPVAAAPPAVVGAASPAPAAAAEASLVPPAPAEAPVAGAPGAVTVPAVPAPGTVPSIP